MVYQIRLASIARDEAERAFEFYKYNPKFENNYAETWWSEFSEALLSLRHHPDRGKPAPEDEVLRAGLRRILFGKGKQQHRLLYLVDDDSVVVVGVRSARRRDYPIEDIAERIE
jgi:plasmid stabilization system protein ParE